MKKLLLTTAIVGAATFAVAAPAKADIQLGLGGHFKGYVTYNDQDDAGVDTRHFDMIRDTEIHFTGETTLDNGLTVGFHAEAQADAGSAAAVPAAAAANTVDDFAVQESYAYFAGNWGRVNVGAEDGAAYLLQVAAPAADTNYDGIRQQINPFNYASIGAGVSTAAAFRTNGGRIDYAQDNSGYADKLTYVTPVFAGFQAGVSYTPDMNQAVLGSPSNVNVGQSRTFGVSASDDGGFGEAYEGALRYEGQYDIFRITLGGGYTHVESDGVVAPAGVLAGLGAAGNTATDSDDAWNAGANVGFSAFNLGGAYKHDNRGLDGDRDQKTWVVGGDYTTGPFVLGASYFHEDTDEAVVAAGPDLKIRRYAGGVTYTYGPGMSFRGSVEQVNQDFAGADADGTSVLLGTQIGF